MLPLASYPFDCCRRLEARADSKARVRFEGNQYSVPVEHALRPLTLKAYWDQGVIVAQDRIVATHRRLIGSGGASLEPLHYLAVLERKPALSDYGEPFVRWKLPPVFAELRQRLESGDPRGLKRFLGAIRAIPQFGLYAVTEAVATALASGFPDVESILQRLRADSQPQVPAGLADVVVPVPDPKRYNVLLSKEDNDGNEHALGRVSQEAAAADGGTGL